MVLIQTLIRTTLNGNTIKITRVHLTALKFQENSKRNTKLLKICDVQCGLALFFVFSIDKFYLILKINPISNKRNYPPPQRNPVTTEYWPQHLVVYETTPLEMLPVS